MALHEKIQLCKCYNCHAIAMEKTVIDYDRIRYDEQTAYRNGFKKGVEFAKKQIAEKLGLSEV